MYPKTLETNICPNLVSRVVNKCSIESLTVSCRRVSSIGLRDVQASVLLNIIFIYRGSGHFSTDANKQFFCEVVTCRLLSKSHWSMISTASLCSNVGTVIKLDSLTISLNTMCMYMYICKYFINNLYFLLILL